jgi:NAD(P)-dependent dehydrogenase (short-subunit alcohol dehydrogenase family)
MKKRVLITGGARGIGRAILEELAPQGHDILATYFTSEKAAKDLAAKFPNVRFIKVDLRDRKDLEQFVKEISGESLDVLVNNAGLWIGKPFAKMSSEELLEQIDLNLTAPALLTRKLLSNLKKSKAPLVVTISSQAANPIFPGEAMYSAVKAGLSTLTNVLRTELNPEGVRLTTFEPFGVNTYGADEPSNMIVPQELAAVVRYVIEGPDHLQLDRIGMSHINQWRGEYPEWIET